MMNKFGSILKEYLTFQNISLKEFAYRIDTTPKNLIDILDGKVELSQNMIYNISFVTEIPVSYIESVENNFKLDKKIDEYLKEENINIKDYIKRFHYKELSKSYNIDYTDVRDDYSILKDILRFLRVSNPKLLYKKDNNILYKSKNDRVELLVLWLEKCYKETLNQTLGLYDKNNINNIVDFIKEEAKNNLFNEEKLISFFNQNGIYLVIQDDLKDSKIRGAFRVLNDKPAIYITRKHQRIADIYFALLHELAHCKSDFNRAKSGSIVSIDNECDELLDYELKADNQAYNWMVNDNIYEKIKEEKKYIFSDEIVPSFLVYRLAKDGIISYSSDLYQKNNPLINKKNKKKFA